MSGNIKRKTAKIILVKNIKHLGHIGDEKEVAPGYARNYLIPKGVAIPATDANRKVFENQKAALQERHVAEQRIAQEIAAKLEGVELTLERQASESGHLYGSVHPRDVVEALVGKGIEGVQKDHIGLRQVIKTLGTYEIDVNLHPEVTRTMFLHVVSPQSSSAF